MGMALAARMRRDCLAGLVAFVVWAMHLLAIYAAGALLCASGPRGRALLQDPERGFVLVATVEALIALAAVLIATWQRDRDVSDAQTFCARVAGAACILAIVAVLWQALPALLIPACS